MAASSVSTGASLFSLPWGIQRSPDGHSLPVYSFSLHKKLEGSSEYIPLACPDAPLELRGGHPLGNIVTAVPIPADLLSHKGLIIGKDGVGFDYMTKQSGAIAMWLPTETDLIWVIAGPTPYQREEDPHLPGVFAPFVEEDAPGDEYLHPDDVWEEFSYESHQGVITDAVDRIYKQFDYVRGIVEKNRQREKHHSHRHHAHPHAKAHRNTAHSTYPSLP
jgi:hypothetical protein